MTSTVKSDIELLILRQRTPDHILKQLAKDRPTAKVDHALVRFYALHLKREGALTEDEAAKYLGPASMPKASKGESEGATLTASEKRAARAAKKAEAAKVAASTSTKPKGKGKGRTRVNASGGDHKV